MNQPEKSPALEANRVSFGYGKELVLKDVSFSINRGEFVALLGPNGSGKTTLLKTVLGTVTPKTGEVRVNGRAVLSYSLKERAKMMAYVSQQPVLNFPMTVRELVYLGRYPHEGRFKQGKDDALVVDEALSLTDSLSLSGRNLSSLSGGEKQKVLISRALAQSSYLLLLDEPTVHLDLYFQLEILRSLKRICWEKELTIVAVLHDLNLASLFADRTLLLKSGELRGFGKTEEVVNETSIQAVFGVKVLARKDADYHTWYFLPRDPLP